jgi:hypothetical protein
MRNFWIVFDLNQSTSSSHPSEASHNHNPYGTNDRWRDSGSVACQSILTQIKVHNLMASILAA